jgi:putative hydrolase of the HAD superfamily
VLDFRRARRRGAILFDLYQTLVPDRPQAARDQVSRQMAAALGVDPDRFAALYRGTMLARMRGEFGTLNETIRTLAYRLGGEPTEAAVRFAEVARLRFTRELLWPPARVLSVLDGLRAAGHPLALVSNCSAETVTLWRGQPLASRFDVAGFSCLLGVAKPDPVMFLKVCGDLGVAPAECVFVGDGHGGELGAAAALGMRAVRTVEFADGDPGWTGPTITRLGDLPAWLAA